MHRYYRSLRSAYLFAGVSRHRLSSELHQRKGISSLFISQFLSIATALGVGLLADRYSRIWRFALFFTALQLLIVIGFYLSSKTTLKAEPLDKGETNVLQLLCYAGIQTLNISYTMLFQIIFQRAVEPYKESLGALYGFWYVYKSIIGITVYYYGGSLSAQSAALPMLIPTALLALQVALMLVLFSLKKLTI